MKYDSIEKYIEDNKYDELFDFSKKWIKDNKRDVELDEYDSAKLDDIKVEKVFFEKANETKDSIVKLIIKLYTDIIVENYDNSDGAECIYKYLRIDAVADLTDFNKSFKIGEAEAYSKNNYKKNKTLTNGLNQYIYNDNIEEKAEEFLRKNCSEVLSYPPKQIPIKELLKKLHLKVMKAPMDDKVFGKTFFASGKSLVYDNDDNVVEKDIAPGTILINPNAFFMRNIGCVNNTIVHEIIHWYFHRNFFRLQRLLNSDLTHIECEVDEIRSSNHSFLEKEYKWMEWQANSIASKVLIPKEMGKLKFKECLERVGMNSSSSIFSKREMYSFALDSFAQFFGVSKLAAKIRLLELGFQQVLGVANYCDGKSVSPFHFKYGSLKNGQTFVVDVKNAAFESFFNKRLKELVDKQEVIYLDHFFVKNDEKYLVHANNGSTHLNDYALNHMDECCYIFDYQIKIKNENNYYGLCYLCRTVDSSSYIETRYSDDNIAELDEAASKKLVMQFQEEEKAFKEMPSSFGGTIKYHYKRKGLTQEILAERSNLSPRYISDLCNEKDVNPSIFTVVAICIGLNLTPTFSRDLLGKFGFDIDGRVNEDYNALKFVIQSCHMCTIESINEILPKLGCKKKIPSEK